MSDQALMPAPEQKAELPMLQHSPCEGARCNCVDHVSNLNCIASVLYTMMHV